MEYFKSKNIQLLLKGFTSFPIFYNFLVDVVGELELDIDKLEKITKFKIEKISRFERVSLFKIFRLWTAIEKVSKRSDIGLVVADYFTIEKAGIIGNLFLETKNLRESIKIVGRFLSLLLGNISIKYYEVDETAVFTFDIIPRFMVPLSAVECYIKICYNWSLQYLDVDSLPVKEIHFYNQKPNHYAYYENNFPKIKIYFNETENYIILDKEIFYVQNKRLSCSNFQSSIEYASYIKEKMKDENLFVQNTVNQILLNLFAGTNNIKKVAEELQISTSTLKRKLKEQNTTFKILTQNIRKDLVKTMIDDDNLSYEEISFLLGYTEYSSFFRAFKRWYKHMPSIYRS